MRNIDLQRFREGLVSIGALKNCNAFGYAVARNGRLVEDILTDVAKATAPCAAMKEFDKARERLFKDMAEKDDQGRPMKHVAGRQSEYVILDRDALETAGTALKEEHQAAFDEQEEINKLWTEEVQDLELKMVAFENLPAEGLTVGQQHAIIEMISDPVDAPPEPNDSPN
jgi:hypothetical protein